MKFTDFVVEIETMNREIEEENEAQEQRNQQMQSQMSYKRSRHGR